MVTALLVAAPVFLGIVTGHDVAGATVALGSFLWTIGFESTPRPLGLRVIVFIALLLGFAGATGALSGRLLWLFVVLTVVWSVFQAVAHISGTEVRLPVAMAALCFLLSAMDGGAGTRGALWRGLLILGGAAWMAVADVVRDPPWSGGGRGTYDIGLAELRQAWPRSRGFAALLAIPTALSAGLAGLAEISHGAWMAVTVLRVLRPDASDTVARSGRRIVGTATGSLFAAVLLGVSPHAATAVTAIVVGVTALLLIGPQRYGYYTCFLTLIALELASVGQRTSWELALVRVALTLMGAAVALASGLLFDRIQRRRSRRDRAA